MFFVFLRMVPGILRSSFDRRGALLQIGAILLTLITVLSGLDWSYFIANRTGALQSFALPAAVLGMCVPLALPVLIAAWATYSRRTALYHVAQVVAAVEASAWLLSVTYKAFTGRIQPEYPSVLSGIDISHGFQFGFWEHGIFWGWPSSHTAVAVALATAVCLISTRRSIRITAVIYAALIAIGVSVSIHWLSDVIAGILLGVAVGRTVPRRLHHSF